MTTSHVFEPMIRKLETWATLEDDDRRALLDLPYTTRETLRGNYVVREGDRPTHSCVLVSGFAYRQKVVGNGGRQILAIHMPGDLVDLQNSLLHFADHSVQALTDTTVARIPVEEIRKLAFGRPAVGMAMWYDTLVDASIHREWMTNIGRRDALQRISHLLCEIGVRLERAGLDSRSKFRLPITQEELADCVGLTPVHVNRTLRVLDREQLVRRPRGGLVVNDWDRLARLGDFDPGYLHLPEDT
ncbi:MAG TPA: Crp/Fnr family transcriptional regulator [Croceibacterium sp.]|nr:Crp/Fnr family transcriptional regulator [Croceibacterium sp.]